MTIQLAELARQELNSCNKIYSHFGRKLDNLKLHSSKKPMILHSFREELSKQ